MKRIKRTQSRVPKLMSYISLYNKSLTNIAQFLQTSLKRTPSIKRTLQKAPKVSA